MDQVANADELRDWLNKNQERLLNEPFPVETEAASIASALSAFYEEVDPDVSGNELERVYDYRTAHGLRFALRGTDIDDIYLGRWRGRFQISACRGADEWSDNLDLPALFSPSRSNDL
jgi:hypothetical protein